MEVIGPQWGVTTCKPEHTVSHAKSHVVVCFGSGTRWSKHRVEGGGEGKMSPQTLKGALGCHSRLKVWSSTFCFAPKLTLVLNKSRNFYGNFLTRGSFTPVLKSLMAQGWRIPKSENFRKKFLAYPDQGSTLVQSRRLNSRLLFLRDTLGGTLISFSVWRTSWENRP